ncbi:MAG TPA: hypothetical protein VMM36_06090 [Opitutaceae bacterium]|nr:hypothetical protein [Opitutaceae bacterium]
MVFVGKVSNGAVILPPDAHLPDGAEVEVRTLAARAESRDAGEAWRFPDGLHLGEFCVPEEEWRLIANDPEA